MKEPSMKRNLLIFLLAAVPLCLCRAQNLLNNADFQRLYDRYPMDWGKNLDGYPNAVELLPDQGPEKQNAVRLDLRELESYGQGGLRLVPGETYEIGAWVRTKDFRCSRSGIIIYNYGWFAESGAKPIPADTNGEWVKLTATITCPPPDSQKASYFRNSLIYTFCIYATQVEGVVDFAAPFLIPVSDKAKEFSRRGKSLLDNVRAVPVSPRLSEIPARDVDVEFFWPNSPEGEIRCNLKGVSAGGKISGHRAKLHFPSLPPGPGALAIEVNQGEGFMPTGEYTVNVLGPAPESAERRLNNLVSEIACRETGPGRYAFFFKEGGWLYVKAGTPEICVDGRALSGFVVDGRHEFMCRIPAGPHEITLDPSAGMPEAVRKIPEMLVYALDDAKFDEAFWEKYLLPVVNAPSVSSAWHPGKQSAEYLAKILKTGRLIVGNGGMHTRKKYDPLQIADHFRHNRFMQYEGCGLVYDELDPASPAPMIQAFTEALWQLQDMKKPVCLWMEWGARLFSPQIHASLISAVANASGGQGRILSESYCRLWSDEKLLETELARYRSIVSFVKSYYPDYPKSMLMIAGGYVSPGDQYILSTSNPECDPKVATELFFKMCADDPVFEGLYGIGVYSIHDSDEEMVRWYGRLLRHYGIEGQKDLLSNRYGFRLKTDFLKNGDFTEGLEHWTASGNVSTGLFENLGKMQGRKWGRGEVKEQKKTLGDTAAVLSPGSSVSQTATGLIPGRQYSAACIIAERKMVESGKKDNTIKPEIEVSISNAEQIEYQKIHAKGFLSLKVIFTAREPQAELTFAAPETTEELVLNYVAFRPYFSGDAEK